MSVTKEAQAQRAREFGLRAKRWREATRARGWGTGDVAEAARIPFERAFGILGGDVRGTESEVALLDALLGAS